MKIIDNLFNGDCGLWYDVTISYKGRLVHCVCPYNVCKSFKDAIDYYYKTFHKKQYTPIEVKHHKYSKQDIDSLLQAC